MNKAAVLSLLAVLTFSAACESKIGGEEEAEGATGAASAEGKAQENTFSIKAPGVDIKVAIPEGIRNNAQVNSESDILYPDATFSGMHVEAQKNGTEKQGGVEIRFTSPTAPEQIAAWYRDPARKDFTVTSAAREGDDFVIAGRQKDNDDFNIRLTPKANGGTDGRIGIQSGG